MTISLSDQSFESFKSNLNSQLNEIFCHFFASPVMYLINYVSFPLGSSTIFFTMYLNKAIKQWKSIRFALKISISISVADCLYISWHISFDTLLLHYQLRCSCFISFPLVLTSLIMFHFYFLQSTVHLIHFIYNSPSHSHLPYSVALILHGHSTLLPVSLFSQPCLWKLTTYKCL